MNAPALLVLYLTVVTLPLGLAAFNGRPPRSVWDELATGAGMLAFAIILVEFVLSGRFRSVSDKVGMDVTMRFHQLAARTALLLALVHPFLYRAPFAYPLPWDPTRQQTLLYDFQSLAGGVAAFVLLPSFVMLSIFRNQIDYRYETWRIAHGLGAVLIAGLLLHHTLEAGRYSQDPILAWTWIAFFAGACATLVYVYVVTPIRHLWRPWVLSAVKPAGERQWSLELEPVGHDGLDYKAGQFGWVGFGRNPFSLEEHPFSFSSAPSEESRIRFLVKELGDFTNGVGRLAPGQPAWIDGPHGNLVVDGHDTPGIALIAGGIGVAPLLGILREFGGRESAPPIVLLYGNRKVVQIAHADELAALSDHSKVEVVHVLSEPPPGWTGRTGLLDRSCLRSLFDREDRRDWLFVLCGPKSMIDSVESALIDMGVPASRILSECFDYD